MDLTHRHMVSVIVPCFNVERYLDQCLTSIECQPFSHIEILCVNDGSTDASFSIMRNHAEHDKRIRVIDKPNEGYGASCNRGITEAQGDYIAIVEPDDWIEGDMYGDMLAFADSLSDTPIDVIKSDYISVVHPDTSDERSVRCTYHGRVHPTHQPFKIADAPELLGHHPSIWSALYRKAWLDEHEIRFCEYPGAGWADNPWLIETLCQAETIAYVGKSYYHYREDTYEKSLTFVGKNALLPLERWNDMQDVIERLGVCDEDILQMQYKRASNYAGVAIDAVGLDYPGLREAVARVFSRCDAELYLANPSISPGSKRLFCELTGRPDPKISNASYAPELLREGFYTLRNNGPSYAYDKARNFLSHLTRRNAGH